MSTAQSLSSKISQAKDSLPDDYRQALEQFDVTTTVDDIAQTHQLNQKESERLDREITYLLLDIQGTSDFLERIEYRIDLDADQSLEIIKAVTNKILRPIQESMEESEQEMPVPPPPPNTGMPDSSSYGGASDPYREPVDDES